MPNDAGSLLSGDGFMPHGMCYLWQPAILGLHVSSDLLIALAYVSISLTLLYFVRRRRDIVFDWMFMCFAIFIVACGATHLMDVLVVWHPLYWLSGYIKATTAFASVTTAVLLVRLMPAALRLPSPMALQDAYAQLEREVAERRAAEGELRAANEQLRNESARARLAAIVDSSEDAIIGKTPEGIISSWNHGAERIFGYTQSEALGRPISMLFPPGHADEEVEILQRIGRGQRVSGFEAVRVRKDGTRIVVSATISPIRDVDGNIVGASKIARDITERKRAEEERREQTEILDLAQVMVRDLAGRIVRWSRGAEALYGYTRDEAVGRLSHELLGTQFSEPLRTIEAQLERSGVWNGELTHRGRDGRPIDVASVWVLHRDSEGRATRILESNTDITERRTAERKLASQVARLHLLHAITRAIGEHQDLASIFQVVVRTLEDQLPVDFGCICLFAPPDSLVVAAVGVKSHDLALALGLHEKAAVRADQNGLSRCVQGQLVYEPDLLGASPPFSQRLSDAGLRAMVAAPLLVESMIFGALIVARRAPASFSSGECEFLGQLSAHVALAAHQAQLHESLQLAYQDLRLTQQAVIRQEKLRVLGQMASGIAHDINNALSPAALYVELLLDRDPNQSAEAKNYLRIIQGAIEGVAKTVARMKEFYGQRDPNRAYESVLLNRAVEQVLDLTRARWSTMPQESGRVIEPSMDLAPQLPGVLGDESEIRDALTNLVVNAVDAMPEGGRLTVRTRALGTDRVQVEVCDTGIGMDEATRSRCLELFFSTKGTRGTGLGLAMVYGTVERHGGELQIDSAPNAGTTIRLIFPSAAPSDSNRTMLPGARPQRPLRILAIDDDPIVLQSLFTILQSDGHSVQVADGGRRGIEAFRAAIARDEPFDVVLTDLGMPHADGRTVAAAVKSARPATPVILLTGWGHRMLSDDDVPPGVDRVLSKPPKLAVLREALAEVTGKPA